MEIIKIKTDESIISYSIFKTTSRLINSGYPVDGDNIGNMMFEIGIGNFKFICKSFDTIESCFFKDYLFAQYLSDKYARRTLECLVMYQNYSVIKKNEDARKELLNELNITEGPDVNPTKMEIEESKVNFKTYMSLVKKLGSRYNDKMKFYPLPKGEYAYQIDDLILYPNALFVQGKGRITLIDGHFNEIKSKIKNIFINDKLV